MDATGRSIEHQYTPTSQKSRRAVWRKPTADLSLLHSCLRTKSKGFNMCRVIILATPAFVVATEASSSQPVAMHDVSISGFWRELVKRITEKFLPHCAWKPSTLPSRSTPPATRNWWTRTRSCGGSWRNATPFRKSHRPRMVAQRIVHRRAVIELPAHGILGTCAPPDNLTWPSRFLPWPFPDRAGFGEEAEAVGGFGEPRGHRVQLLTQRLHREGVSRRTELLQMDLDLVRLDANVTPAVEQRPDHAPTLRGLVAERRAEHLVEAGFDLVGT
jgi:hypothetical protein